MFEQSNSANPFVPSSHGLSFQAGEMGFGHITVMSKNFDAMEGFYRNHGLGVSDYVDWEIIRGLSSIWLYACEHSAPLVGGWPNARVSEATAPLHVGSGRPASSGGVFRPHSQGRHKGKERIGVHPNDKSLTFYVKSPSGFEAELGAEGVHVNPEDPDREVGQYDQLSIWGHRMTKLDTLPLKAAPLT